MSNIFFFCLRRTLLADRPIELAGSTLRLRFQNGDTLYDARTFRRSGEASSGRHEMISPLHVIEGGLVRDGVFRSVGERSPNLILHRMGLPAPFRTNFELDGTGGLASPAMPFAKISVNKVTELLRTTELDEPVQTMAAAIEFSDPPIVASLVVSTTTEITQFNTPLVESRLFLTDTDGLTRANVLLKSGLVSRAEATTLPVIWTNPSGKVDRINLDRDGNGNWTLRFRNKNFRHAVSGGNRSDRRAITAFAFARQTIAVFRQKESCW